MGSQTDQVQVVITADPSGLRSGFQEAVNIVNSGAGAMGAVLKEFAIGFGSALAAGFSVDKLIEIGNRSIETADKINKMAQQVGIGTEALSALQAQAALSDVAFDQFGVAMTRMARSATEAAEGSKQQLAAYQALGVQVTTTAGQMRPMEDVLQDVATKLSQMRDGAQKTALAQEIFGRSGAQLIPMLNELGTQGFAKVREEAEAYNQVIGQQFAKNAETFNDNLRRVHMGVTGFANAVVEQLLPGLVKISEQMADAAKSNDKYAASAKPVATAIKYLIVGFSDVTATILSMKEVFVALLEMVGGAGDIFNGFAKGVMDDFTAIGEAMRGNFAAAKVAFANAGTDLANGWQVGIDRIKHSWDGVDTAIQRHLDGAKARFDALLGTFSNVQAGSDTTAKRFRDFGNSVVESLEQVTQEAQKFLNSLDAVGADKYTKALEAYNNQLIRADEIFTKLVLSGASAEQAINFIGDATQKAADGFNAIVQAIRNENDVDAILSLNLARASADLNEQIRLLGLDEEARKADALATKLITDALGDLHDFVGPLTEDQQRMIDRLRSLATEFTHTSTVIEQSKKVQQEWASIWTQGFNQLADTIGQFFTGQLDGWSDFGSKLVDIAKQIVASIISQFAKLAVINPILNAVFGTAAGGGSLLPTLANAAGGIFGGGGTGAAGSGGGFSGSNLAGMGQQIFGGFQHAFDNFMFGGGSDASGIFGSYSANMYGPGGTFAPSAVGWGASVAGGVYAGYNRYQNSAGGFAGAAGGLTYGVGTTAVGLGLASVATGGGFAAGVGALGALGPIGWAAIALMAVDMISGGKLFGTKGKFNFGEQAITVGAGGATVSAGYDLKGQQALFGGSTHSWQTLPVDPAAQKAADDFYNALKSQTEQFAKQFGTTMGDIVGGQFIATFDKHGNVTKTSSTVLGQTYAEDQQHFQERLAAENMIAVLDSLNTGLSSAIDQYRQDADQLMAVTQALASAQGMIQNGTKFLALGTDQSLTALLKLAQGMQGFGETIDQTIQRIEQAQAQYDQFVAQFKPAATFASPFQAALADIDQQMMQNIATANALAKAAGAEGASTEDLANIHAYAAAQFAAAVAKLKSDANSLAASLGYAMPQSLDDINAQIAALEAQANSGANAIGGFSSAMTNAAQAATNAMNLLLGDLSPLNDQEKLAKAMQGLRAGTATAEQVLEIGRRLYATGSDYNALFEQVMQMTRNAHAAVGGSGGGGGHGGLTAAQRQQLAELEKQRDQLEEAKRHTDAMTLAQQIADIVSSTGESIDQALADVGIKDIGPFIKDLGLGNKDDFTNLITKLEANTDSAGDNTREIAQRLDLTNELLADIRDGTHNVVLNTDPSNAPNRSNAAGNGDRGQTSRNPPLPRGTRQTPPPELQRTR